MYLENIKPASWIQRYVDGDRLVVITYILSVSGVFADQVSTRIGLTHPNIVELNHITASFLNIGVWLYIDITAVIITILVSHLVIRYWSFKFRRLITLLPLTFGALKLVTGISNLHLYYSLV